MKRSAVMILGVVLLTLSSGSVLQAAVVGDGTPSSCTQVALETALTVSSSQGGGVIRFRCGVDPITIPLTVADGIPVVLTIPTQTTIDGGGLVTLDGQSPATMVLVPANASVELKNLTLIHGLGRAMTVEGTLTLTNSTVTGRGQGTGIVNQGTLTIGDSTLSLNRPAIINTGALTLRKSRFFDNRLSAIDNRGTAEAVSCVWSGNGADNGGGAISNGEQSSFTVRNSVFTNNLGGVHGGAIANAATLVVENSTFFANGALGFGGAISNAGTLTLRDSQLINNGSEGGVVGGAVFNSKDAFIDRSFLVGNTAKSGGGIRQSGTGTLTISNSFILLNRASLDGGGISVAAGATPPTLDRTTVTGNTPNNVGS